MAVRNSDVRYGAVAMVFHWVIAALLLCNIALGTEGKKFPFITIHIGKTEFLHPLYYVNIELLCDIKDDTAGHARGDQDIVELFVRGLVFGLFSGCWLV